MNVEVQGLYLCLYVLVLNLVFYLTLYIHDITGYKVGYISAGCDLVLDASGIPKFQMQNITLDKLIAAATAVDITHMCIAGDIPPHMETIAPNLEWLMIEEMSRTAQLQRYLSFLSFQTFQ